MGVLREGTVLPRGHLSKEAVGETRKSGVRHIEKIIVNSLKPNLLSTGKAVAKYLASKGAA